jgi:hypothetical protein
MTSLQDRCDSTVPIGSTIIQALKAGGPQSGSDLARRQQLRKANVLVACRALAAVGQICRMGQRWALRPPVRCAGMNNAGRRCGRAAAYGSAVCVHHEPDADVPPVIVGIRPASTATQVPPLAALPSAAESVNSSRAVTSLAPPAECPLAPQTSEAVPELFVNGRRVTEPDVIEALSMLGDEEVQAYREGRLPKREAYRIAYHRLRTFVRLI